MWLSGCRAGYFDVRGCQDADHDTLMCGCQDVKQGTLMCVVVRMQIRIL